MKYWKWGQFIYRVTLLRSKDFGIVGIANTVSDYVRSALQPSAAWCRTALRDPSRSFVRKNRNTVSDTREGILTFCTVLVLWLLPLNVRKVHSSHVSLSLYRAASTNRKPTLVTLQHDATHNAQRDSDDHLLLDISGHGSLVQSLEEGDFSSHLLVSSIRHRSVPK